jgi:hypothetical protein
MALGVSRLIDYLWLGGWRREAVSEGSLLRAALLF